MLVIDDESDYASINTKGEEDPTVINEKIRLLLQKFKKELMLPTQQHHMRIFLSIMKLKMMKSARIYFHVTLFML